MENQEKIEITEKEINLLYTFLNLELESMDEQTSQSWLDILQTLEKNIPDNEEDNDIQS